MPGRPVHRALPHENPLTIQTVPQHEMITSMTPTRRQKIGARLDIKYGTMIRVRCRCMAEYRNASTRYFNFEWLADVIDLRAARRVYEDHVRAMTILLAVADFHRRYGQA